MLLSMVEDFKLPPEKCKPLAWWKSQIAWQRLPCHSARRQGLDGRLPTLPRRRMRLIKAPKPELLAKSREWPSL